MDGVAWTQLVVGNTVFVGGNFANARPANAAPGVNTVPRTNLMAYTLSTGELTSFAPTLNARSARWPPRPTARRCTWVGSSPPSTA